VRPFTLDDAAIAEPRQAKIPSIDKLDEAVLPVDVASRYHVTEMLPPPPAPMQSVSSLEVSGQLTEIVDLSLVEARKMIERPWEDLTEKEQSIKSGLIQTMFSTQVKVDDTRLRSRQVDMLPKILELIAKEEKRLPKMIEG